MLELDWFARTYGWPPAVTLQQPRHILHGFRLLRDYRRARGGGG